MTQPLLGHFRDQVCPYCFEDFLLSDTPYRCANPEARRCEPEIDPLRRRIWEHTFKMPKVVRPSLRLLGQEARCDTCGVVTAQRLCPHCHMELPQRFGNHRSLILAVLGAKASGKSHYLAVLITQLRKHLSADLNFALEAINEDTRRRFHDDFYRPIYEQGVPIAPTQSGRGNTSRVRQPLLYELHLLGSGRRGRNRVRRSVTLVFFDTAGEDLNREETMNIANRYVGRADGILMLLDPLQLPYVRSSFSTSQHLPSEEGHPWEIISRTISMIRKNRRQRKGRISTPIALAFSKLDAVEAVEELVHPQMQILSHSTHERGFNLRDHLAVNDEMQALLEGWESAEIIQQVRSAFKRYAFFGFSALGCNPHRDRKIPSVLPKRVEDPFLWLLYQQGFLGKARMSS